MTGSEIGGWPYCPRCGLRHDTGRCVYALTVDELNDSLTDLEAEIDADATDPRCPHGRNAASRRDNPCPGNLPGCLVPLPAAVKLLASLEALIGAARAAIADEAEGKLRAVVFEIHHDAAELLTEVQSW